ncbi:MAG: hypothetical protein HQK53_11750, partial [Oligoflexia bacterium]|nr:hypothetical protein [Oligoflexia bacterium]
MRHAHLHGGGCRRAVFIYLRYVFLCLFCLVYLSLVQAADNRSQLSLTTKEDLKTLDLCVSASGVADDQSDFFLNANGCVTAINRIKKLSNSLLNFQTLIGNVTPQFISEIAWSLINNYKGTGSNDGEVRAILLKLLDHSKDLGNQDRSLGLQLKLMNYYLNNDHIDDKTASGLWENLKALPLTALNSVVKNRTDNRIDNGENAPAPMGESAL